MSDEQKTREQLIAELAALRARVAELERTHEDTSASVPTWYDPARFLQEVSDAIVGTDAELRILTWNRAAEQLFGWPAEEVLGRRTTEVAPVRYPDGVDRQAAIDQLMRQGFWKGEAIITHRDGHEIVVEGSTSIIRDTNGQRLGLVNINHDITARDQATAALTQQKEMLQAIFDHIPVMVAVLSPAGKLQMVNREWQRVLGWSAEEAQNRSFLAEMYPDPAYRRMVAEYIASPVTMWKDFKTRVRDGRTIDTRWANVHLSDGTCIGIGQDMTEQKRLEAHLIQTQKIESIGRLAGGIAHDFNNLLTAMIGHTVLALDILPDGDPLRGDLRAIEDIAARATALTRQLLAFARRQMLEPRVINLNDLILNMGNLLRRVIGADVDLITLGAPDLGNVRVDPGQIEQLIVNLAVNARDAMPLGGKLTIETANVLLDEEDAHWHIGVVPGPYVLLSVSDTGTGMSPEVLARLFEPFFTTKPPGQGTGLGLATCYGIVKQHGGQIICSSVEGHGATFRIYLPRVAEAVDPPIWPDKAPDLPRGSERLLLVEDEAPVRALAVRVLSDLGYTVFEAANGVDALQVTREQSDARIHLLLTDVVMPQMGGRELAERLMEMQPGIKVLFISGYTDDAVIWREQPDAGIGFLQKPFSPGVLARKVRELLDG